MIGNRGEKKGASWIICMEAGIEGVMSDRHISNKLKGKVLGACVTPAMLYGLETLPVSEKHQHRLQVREHNWVRRIAGVKRVDRWRMGELREEVGIQKCLIGRLVKSRVKWAGHVERMKEDRLPRMVYVHQERRKRGRPRMRWRDCIERRSWRTWTGGWWPRIEESGGVSSTGRQRRVATLTPEIRETRKREKAIRSAVVEQLEKLETRFAPFLATTHIDATHFY